jgi:membrane protease YdiL (CAAX protease family)
MAPASLLSVVVIYYATQTAAGLIIYIYPLVHGWTARQTSVWLQQSVLAQFFYILLAEALTMTAIFFILRWFKWTWRTIGLIKPKARHILLGILAVVPYFAIYIMIVAVVSHFYPSLNIGQKQQIGFDSTKGTLELVLVFISLVVLPPLVEEIMMRGFLYTGVRKMFGKFISALLVSALFGIAHLTEGGAAGPLWIGALDTFALSLVLVSLREITGNLWAGITLHAIKNGIAFFSLFILAAR